MIIKTITQYDFVNEFTNSDTYKNKFTRPALFALYDYLDSMSWDMKTDIVLDIVAIACDYTEYESAYEAMEQYQPEDMPTVDIEDIDLVELTKLQEELALDWLQQRTQVIEFDGGIIIQNF